MEVGKQKTESAPGSGQIKPVRPGAEGIGNGLGVRCGPGVLRTVGLNSQVQAEKSEVQLEGRKLLKLVSQCPECEWGGRATTCPQFLSEAEKLPHTALTSCECPDRRPHGSLCHWTLARGAAPSAPAAALQPIIQMGWEN